MLGLIALNAGCSRLFNYDELPCHYNQLLSVDWNLFTTALQLTYLERALRISDSRFLVIRSLSFSRVLIPERLLSPPTDFHQPIFEASVQDCRELTATFSSPSTYNCVPVLILRMVILIRRDPSVQLMDWWPWHWFSWSLASWRAACYPASTHASASPTRNA